MLHFEDNYYNAVYTDSIKTTLTKSNMISKMKNIYFSGYWLSTEILFKTARIIIRL